MWLSATRVGIINGLLALVGICIALYVAISFPLPAEIPHHQLDKFGLPVGPENTLLYLFVFPCFQMWLVFMGWWAIRKNVGEKARADKIVAKARKLFPWVRPAEPSAKSFQFVLVTVQFGLLVVTIGRVVALALGNI
jgi:hypothetical protein